MPDEVKAVLDRIARGIHTEADLAVLRRHLLFDPARAVWVSTSRKIVRSSWGGHPWMNNASAN